MFISLLFYNLYKLIFRIQCRCYNTSTVFCTESSSFTYIPPPIIENQKPANNKEIIFQKNPDYMTRHIFVFSPPLNLVPPSGIQVPKYSNAVQPDNLITKSDELDCCATNDCPPGTDCQQQPSIIIRNTPYGTGSGTIMIFEISNSLIQ